MKTNRHFPTILALVMCVAAGTAAQEVVLVAERGGSTACRTA
ncbi:hypothetical protein [Noviherbaspirillum denitrificans]|nr:hypothetical protein [Noviherbaspirillum denitrificans]